MKVEAVLSGALSPSALGDQKQAECSKIVSTSLKLETSSQPAAGRMNITFVVSWFDRTYKYYRAVNCL